MFYAVFSLQEFIMEFTVETNLESRKEWVAPKMKKIDVEEITAHGIGQQNDGNGAHTKS
jgi:hypothetical protein